MKKFKAAFDQKPQAQVFGESEYKDTFEGEIPYDIIFPNLTLREPDEALKKWFNKDQPFYIRIHNKEPKKVDVVLSTEERWSMMQKHPELRNAKGQLKLPLISIKRESVDLLMDRTLPVDELNLGGWKLYVQEYINPSNKRKEYILNTKKDNTLPIVEIISLQAAKYVTIIYSVFFWSNFMEHLNQMIQHMTSKMGQHHAIFVDKSLWYSAFIQQMTNDSNDSAIQQDERIFKTNFTIKVEAPLIDKNMIKRTRTIQGIDVKISRTIPDYQQQQNLEKLIKNNWNNPYKLM